MALDAASFGKSQKSSRFEQFDADVAAAFGIEARIDHPRFARAAFIAAAKHDGAVDFDGMAANKASAVPAHGGGPGFFFPGMARIFPAQPYRNAGFECEDCAADFSPVARRGGGRLARRVWSWTGRTALRRAFAPARRRRLAILQAQRPRKIDGLLLQAGAACFHLAAMRPDMK